MKKYDLKIEFYLCSLKYEHLYLCITISEINKLLENLEKINDISINIIIRSQ